MQTRYCELPGIGKRVSLVTNAGQMIVLILHHSGKKELYFFPEPKADEADYSVVLSDEEARELASHLLGLSFQAVPFDKMQAFQKHIVFEWLSVQASSSLAGKPIKETMIRTRTGANVIGIVREGEIIAAPSIDEVIYSGDTLIVSGKPEQVAALEKLCAT